MVGLDYIDLICDDFERPLEGLGKPVLGPRTNFTGVHTKVVPILLFKEALSRPSQADSNAVYDPGRPEMQISKFVDCQPGKPLCADILGYPYTSRGVILWRLP